MMTANEKGRRAVTSDRLCDLIDELIVYIASNKLTKKQIILLLKLFKKIIRKMLTTTTTKGVRV
jgi:hypothetical protein